MSADDDFDRALPQHLDFTDAGLAAAQRHLEKLGDHDSVSISGRSLACLIGELELHRLRELIRNEEACI